MFVRFLAILVSLTSVQALAQHTIPAYNTYQSVPFVVDAKSGLAADLVAYLNTKLQGKYVLVLETIPRERLHRDVLAAPDFQGVVLLLSPQFVDDSDQTKFAWTPAVMMDANIVISSDKRRLEYKGPKSLVGLKFEGVRGHRYADLEDHFGSEIHRENVTSELQALKMIAADRADVTVMGRSTYGYLDKVNAKADGFAGKLHVSSAPHINFARALFVSKQNTALFQELSSVASHMLRDEEWRSILAKYEVKNN